MDLVSERMPDMIHICGKKLIQVEYSQHDEKEGPFQRKVDVRKASSDITRFMGHTW